VFAPVFRVRTPPDDDAPAFLIPMRSGNNWFDNGWAWDTTAVPSSYSVPDDKDRRVLANVGLQSDRDLDLIGHSPTEADQAAIATLRSIDAEVFHVRASI
jgi:hypothetical protein